MMKIALATSSFRGGGITSYACEFIKAFKDKYELSVLIGDDSKDPIEDNKVKVYNCESLDITYNNAEYALHLIRDVITPDILFISNSRVVTLIIPYLPDNIRVISICHSQKYIEADIASFRAKYIDSIITLSQYCDQYVKSKFKIKDDNKCKVIPNFVHPLPNAVTILEKKINKEPLRLLFMGGSSGSKSPDIVFAILKELKKTDKNFTFYWLGSDVPPMKRFLPFKHVSELFKGDNRFIFTGKIPRQEALSISESANVILIPSRREGCPIALLEAMRTGVITITSDYNTACKDMIVQNETGIINNHKRIKQFVDSIIDIIDNRSSYEHYYMSSYDYYLSHYSYEVWCGEMEKLFNQGQRNHKQRKKAISKWKYMLDKIHLFILVKYNYIIQLVEETIIPFGAFWRYSKR